MSSSRNPHAIQTAEDRAYAEALFRSIGDGAIATDEFGKITRINPTALDILGYKESEVLSKWFPETFVALDESGKPIPVIDRPITRAFLTGKSISEKMHYRRRNGSMVPVAITVSPILIEDRPIGAIEVFRDITIEDEIDRMKSEFISLASHQLRTPLSSIKTYAHMLIEGYMGDITPQQVASLRTIVDASNRMNELISTLLNVTRIESGTVAISPKATNLTKLCEEVIKDHALQASNKSITLTCEAPSSPVTLRTDTLLVKEILSNLVSNAIKYTAEQGMVHIELSSQRQQVIFKVTDTGMGIPRESQDQVFTKFFRGANAVRYETTGTGLGLYLVKGLTEKLGGKIWFDSEEGKGSAFYLCLPQIAVKKAKKTQTPQATKPRHGRV